jgi:hypothetical protein
MSRRLLSFLILLLMPTILLGQEPNGAACKINNENWCGSGSVCGYDENGFGGMTPGKPGAYVLTNAHVSSTKPNDRMNLLFKLPNGAERTYDGYAKIIAYTRQSVDWAIVWVPDLTPESGIEPLKISKVGITGTNDYTHTGSPRCAWPLVTVQARLTSGSPQGVQFFLPNAIGGQSGSSLWRIENNKRQAEILLTWSYGRGSGATGAGQPTNLIFNNMVGRSSIGPKPDPNLIELGNPFMQDRGLEEGFFESAEVTNFLGKEASSRGTKVAELPIWVEDDEPEDPEDPEDPPVTTKLTEEEVKACEMMKSLNVDLIGLSKYMESILGDPLPSDTDTSFIPPTLNPPLESFSPEDGIKVIKKPSWTPPPVTELARLKTLANQTKTSVIWPAWDGTVKERRILITNGNTQTWKAAERTQVCNGDQCYWTWTVK